VSNATVRTKPYRRIFISYAHRGGAELAERLQKDLTSSGFDAWLDKQRLRSGAVWGKKIEQQIDTLQVCKFGNNFCNDPTTR
jgi:hypothetical protein